jgi:hypothetical protein
MAHSDPGIIQGGTISNIGLDLIALEKMFLQLIDALS